MFFFGKRKFILTPLTACEFDQCKIRGTSNIMMTTWKFFAKSASSAIKLRQKYIEICYVHDLDLTPVQWLTSVDRSRLLWVEVTILQCSSRIWGQTKNGREVYGDCCVFSDWNKLTVQWITSESVSLSEISTQLLLPSTAPLDCGQLSGSGVILLALLPEKHLIHYYCSKSFRVRIK